jgi:hypothetical protein
VFQAEGEVLIPASRALTIYQTLATRGEQRNRLLLIQSGGLRTKAWIALLLIASTA